MNRLLFLLACLIPSLTWGQTYHSLMADPSLRFSLATYNGPDSAENQAGASLDAVWTGTPTYGDNKFGGAAFDVASGRFLHVLDAPIPTAWTLFCRVYPRTLPAAGSNASSPLHWGTAAGNVFSHSLYYGNVTSFAQVNDGGDRIVGMPPLVTATWQSMAATGSNSGTIRGYLNGTIDPDSSAIGTAYSSGNRWLIGRAGTKAGGNNVAVDGLIAEILQFSRVLDASEVAELHAGPEPTNTVAPTLDATTGDWTVGTWDSYSNGSLTYTVLLKDDADDSTVATLLTDSATTSGNCISDLATAGAGTYYIEVVAANGGGYSDVVDSATGVFVPRTYEEVIDDATYYSAATGAGGSPTSWLASSTVFNGTSTTINTGVAWSVDSGATLAAWVRRDAIAGGCVFGAAGNSNITCRFSANDDTFQTIIGGFSEGITQSTHTVTNQLPATTWLHIAFVVASGEVKLYINGVLQSTRPHSTPAASGNVLIGARSTSEYFAGQVAGIYYRNVSDYQAPAALYAGPTTTRRRKAIGSPFIGSPRLIFSD